MGRRAAWDEAKNAYPSWKNDEQHWVEFFDAQPDVMWQILGDIAKVYVATEGERRVGRRPGVSMSLEDLQKIIEPSYSMDPITTSLPELIGGRSQRAFAARVPVHHSTLQRFIAGTHVATKEQLEAMAKAGRVGPAYFLEWRQMFVVQALTAVFAERPNLSIAAYKRLTAATR